MSTDSRAHLALLDKIHREVPRCGTPGASDELIGVARARWCEGHGHRPTNTKHDLPAFFVRSAYRFLLGEFSALRDLLCVDPSLRATGTSSSQRRDARRPLANLSCGWPCRINTEPAESAEIAEKKAIGASRGIKAALSSKLIRWTRPVHEARCEPVPGINIYPAKCAQSVADNTQKTEAPAGPTDTSSCE